MIYNPSSEQRQLILIILVSLFIGSLIGEIAWTLVVSLLAYVLWNLRQLFRLHRWLKSEHLIDPPSSVGLWGAIFDDFYRLQQTQLRYRARLKRVIKRFRDSTYALKEGFVMLDALGNIEWWNPAAEQLLGLRAPQDTNQLVTNLIRDPRFKQYFLSENYQKPLEITSPINSSLCLQYQLAQFGRRDHLMIVRDVTEIKRLERVRTDFVANVSHELRTPLTVIDGYLETLSDNSVITPPPWGKALKQMTQQTRRMNSLIRDLIVLSSLETEGNSRLQQRINMKALIDQVVSDLTPLLESGHHRLTIDCRSSQQLTGHHQQLYSLLSNLLVNACKYSEEGGKITVSWEQDGAEARLTVTDTGVGISAFDLPRITERFYRVDKGRSLTTGGTGLGLAIVKHVLINHDGKLDIESKPGTGSTFSCCFPAHRLTTEPLSAAN